MNNSLLLPSRYKRIGWMIFIPMLLLGIFMIATNYEVSWLQSKVFALFSGFPFEEKKGSHWLIETNLTNTIVGVFFIIGALLVGFSKEKNEDEYIASIRLKALLWAVLVNYIILIIAFVLIYELPFITVMTFNMFTVLLLFIFRFHYLLFGAKKLLMDEQ